MKNIKIFLPILLVVVGTILYFSFRKSEPPKVYKDIKVEYGNFNSTISTTGIVTPRNRLEIKSPVSARVDEILFEEGAELKKTEIVAWVSSSERVSLLDAALSKGEDELKKWQDIYKATPIISPIDGTLINVHVKPGQSISPSDVVLTIADDLIVLAQVDETDIAKVKLDAIVEVTLDAYPETEIKGSVEHIAFDATTSENVTVYQVKIKLDNPPEFMKSGMSVDVIFILEELKDVPYLPASAIFYDDNGAHILVGDNLEKKYVELGEQFEKNIEIKTKLDDSLNIKLEETDFSSSKSGSSNPFFNMNRRRGKKK